MVDCSGVIDHIECLLIVILITVICVIIFVIVVILTILIIYKKCQDAQLAKMLA